MAAEEMSEAEEIIKEGYLELQEGKGAFRTFKRRYMVIKRSGVIELHSSQENHRRQRTPKENFNLQGGEELIAAVPYKNRFRIKVVIALHKKEKRWCFAFESESTQKAWIAAFDGVLKHLAALLQLNEALTGSNMDTLQGQIKIGEALAECGQLSKARRIFKKLVSEFEHGDASETAHESYERFLSHYCKDAYEAEANFVQRKKYLCVPRQFIGTASGAEFTKLTRRVQFMHDVKIQTFLDDENAAAEKKKNTDDDEYESYDYVRKQKMATATCSDYVDIEEHWPFYLFSAIASQYAQARQLAQKYLQQQGYAKQYQLEYSYKDIEQHAWFIMNECVDGKRNNSAVRLQARLQAVADADHQKRLSLKQQMSVLQVAPSVTRQMSNPAANAAVETDITSRMQMTRFLSREQHREQQSQQQQANGDDDGDYEIRQQESLFPDIVDDILDELKESEQQEQKEQFEEPGFEVMPSIVDNTEELRHTVGRLQFADLDKQRQSKLDMDKLTTFAFAMDEETIRDAYLLNTEVTDILDSSHASASSNSKKKRVSHRSQTATFLVENTTAANHPQGKPHISQSMNRISDTELRESALLAVDEILDHVFGTIYEVLHRESHHLCPWTAFLLVWRTRRDEMRHIGERAYREQLCCVLEFVYLFVGGVFEQFDYYGESNALLLCSLYASVSPERDPEDVRTKLCVSAVRVMSSDHIAFTCKLAVSKFLSLHRWLRMITGGEKRVTLRRCFERGLRGEMRRILSTLRSYYRDTVFTDLLYYDLLAITTKHKVAVAIDTQGADKVQGKCTWGPFADDRFNSTELANVCAARKISPVPEAKIHPGSFEECYLLLCHEMSKVLNAEFHRQIQLALKMHKIAYVQFEATPVKNLERCLALLHNELTHFSSPKAAKILDYCKCTVTFACVKDLMHAFDALDTKFKVCKIVNFFDAKHNKLGSNKFLNVYLICKHKDVKALRLICEVKLTLHTLHELHTQRNDAKLCYGEMLNAAQIKAIVKDMHSNFKK